MRTIIAGSRSATSHDVQDAWRACPWRDDVTVVLSGTAAGADRYGEQLAARHGLSVERHPADWNAYGKAAGFRRNCEMVAAAAALIAVWDGESRGTAHVIEVAQRRGLRVFVWRTNGNVPEHGVMTAQPAKENEP